MVHGAWILRVSINFRNNSSSSTTLTGSLRYCAKIHNAGKREQSSRMLATANLLLHNPASKLVSEWSQYIHDDVRGVGSARTAGTAVVPNAI
jgi:hypothetical protein